MLITIPLTADEVKVVDGAAMVCVHELLLLALALTWLAVQVLLLLGCCVLVNRSALIDYSSGCNYSALLGYYKRGQDIGCWSFIFSW